MGIDGCLSSGRRILVHCHAGVSRSATVVLAFLMQKRFDKKEQDKSAYEWALQLAKSRRRCVGPNPGFVKQLIAFEECGMEVPAAEVYRPLVAKASPAA